MQGDDEEADEEQGRRHELEEQQGRQQYHFDVLSREWLPGIGRLLSQDLYQQNGPQSAERRRLQAAPPRHQIRFRPRRHRQNLGKNRRETQECQQQME